MSRDSSPQKNLRLDTFNIVALAILSSLRFFSVPVVTQSIFTVLLHFKLIQIHIVLPIKLLLFSHCLLTFISLLQGKRNFSFLLSSSSVIRSE